MSLIARGSIRRLVSDAEEANIPGKSRSDNFQMKRVFLWEQDAETPPSADAGTSGFGKCVNCAEAKKAGFRCPAFFYEIAFSVTSPWGARKY